MTTFANYPIEKIEPHPNNVRRATVADPELVDSVRAAGVLEPVVLGPDTGDGTRLLIAGNRRHAAAVEAGLTQLPAVLRDDLATDAQQVEAMLIENLHRSDLTAVEEADAYEQLQLFGMDPAAIAKATGRAKTTVTSRLKLAGLPDKAKSILHGGQITIGDAESLLEFEDDHEAFAQLQSALGTPNFRWKVQDLVERRKRVARNAKMVAEFRDDLGAVAGRLDDDPQPNRVAWFRAEELRDPTNHAECLGYIEPGQDSYAAPYLVCLDPEQHEEVEAAARAASSTPGIDPARQAELEAEREQRAAQDAARRAAARVRVEWLTDHYAALLPAKGKASQGLAAAVGAFLPILLGDEELGYVADEESLAAGLGHIDAADGQYGWQRAQTLSDARRGAAADQVAAAAPAAAVRALAGVLAALTDTTLTADFPDDPDALMRQGKAWEWLEGAGYELSDVDRAERTRIENTLADLVDDEEQAS